MLWEVGLSSPTRLLHPENLAYPPLGTLALNDSLEAPANTNRSNRDLVARFVNSFCVIIRFPFPLFGVACCRQAGGDLVLLVSFVQPALRLPHIRKNIMVMTLLRAVFKSFLNVSSKYAAAKDKQWRTITCKISTRTFLRVIVTAFPSITFIA